MIALHKVGMDGVEDPSDLGKEDLIYLQTHVGNLSIVPDKIIDLPIKASAILMTVWGITNTSQLYGNIYRG